jgi:hypothetical protein
VTWAFGLVLTRQGGAPMERGWRQVTLWMRSESPDSIIKCQELAPNASSLGLRPHLTPPLPRRNQRAWSDEVSSLGLRRADLKGDKVDQWTARERNRAGNEANLAFGAACLAVHGATKAAAGKAQI